MPGRSTRESVVLALKSIGTEANVVAEANSTRTLLALVDAGMGAAIVPSWVGDRGDLRWGRIAEPISPMTVPLYTVAGVPRSETVNVAIQLAERIVLERVQLPDRRGGVGIRAIALHDRAPRKTLLPIVCEIMLDVLRQFSGGRSNMLNREYVDKVISFCTGKADFAAFQAHTACAQLRPRVHGHTTLR